jgi:hypothetical protein
MLGLKPHIGTEPHLYAESARMSSPERVIVGDQTDKKEAPELTNGWTVDFSNLVGGKRKTRGHFGVRSHKCTAPSLTWNDFLIEANWQRFKVNVGESISLSHKQIGPELTDESWCFPKIIKGEEDARIYRERPIEIESVWGSDNLVQMFHVTDKWRERRLSLGDGNVHGSFQLPALPNSDDSQDKRGTHKPLREDGKLSRVFNQLNLQLQLLVAMFVGLFGCFLNGLSYSFFERGSVKSGLALWLSGAGLFLCDGLVVIGSL